MALCYDRYGRSYYCNSSWYSWGRWVLLGVIIFAFIAIYFLFSCISARRRRKAGRRPMYGTGWVPAPPAYTPNYNQQQPPNNYNYNSTAQQGYYGQNQGYFGGQQTGVEAPKNTYQQNVYQPPPGPPPPKA